MLLDNGKELPADVIVYATGYGSMNGWVADLICAGDGRQGRQGAGASAPNTTKDPGPWEGEQRNMWKPTQQEALWFHGGNLHQSRHYSQFLSLQLKARHGGHPDAGLRQQSRPPRALSVLRASSGALNLSPRTGQRRCARIWLRRQALALLEELPQWAARRHEGGHRAGERSVLTLHDALGTSQVRRSRAT